MKHLKSFESNFWGRHSDWVEYNYLNMDMVKNGDMKLTLTEEGLEKVEDEGINYDNFYDYFDDIRANSEFIYFGSLGDAGLGMTEAPGITDGYYFDDDGNIVEENDSEIYWYPNYIMKDFTEELSKNGSVIFSTLSPKSKEEIEQQQLKNDTKKYNL